MEGLELLLWMYYAFCGFLLTGFVAFGAGLILLAIGCFYDIGAWSQYGLWLTAGGAVPCLIWLYIMVKGRSDE